MPPKGSGRGWGRNGDPEKAKVRAYEWRERNSEKLKFVQRANAINMRDAVGKVTYADLMAIYVGQQGCCRYCRTSLDEGGAETDHILPIEKGGSNWSWNIQFVCFDCNRRKSTRHPLEFEEEEGFFGKSWYQFFEQKPVTKSVLICEAL